MHKIYIKILVDRIFKAVAFNLTLTLSILQSAAVPMYSSALR